MIANLRPPSRIAIALVFCGSLTSAVQAIDYHVNKGVECTDSNPGSSTQPLCTVQAGLNKLSAAGDAVIIHTGVYAECATLSRPSLRGTATRPLRIKGADGESPAGIVIDASVVPAAECLPAPNSCDTATRRGALTLKGSWGGHIGYVQVSNLTVRPPSLSATVTKNNGLDLQCVDHIEIKGIRSDSQPTAPTEAGAETGDAVINMYNSQYVLVDGADISNGGVIRPGFHAVMLQDGGTSDIVIVNSKVRDLDGGFVCQSGGVNRVDIMFNDVSNMDSGCDGENLVQVYNVDFIRLAYNRFVGNAGYVVRPRGYASQSSHTRLIVNNNLFRARSSGQTAVQFGYAAEGGAMWLGIFRNNVISGYSTGFSYLASGVKDCDVTEDNNAFYSVGTPVVDVSGCGFTKGLLSRVLLTNPLGSNDCPAAASPLINGGFAKSSTPKQGTGAADIGACEDGQTAGAWTNPYDFKPDDASPSASPRITWDGADDINVNLRNLDFMRFLKGAAQTQYECQVDPLYTFNSQGIGAPMWSSGPVSSSVKQCPVAFTLPQGDYYARVRLNGQLWSDAFKFSVGAGASVPPSQVQSLERRDVLKTP